VKKLILLTIVLAVLGGTHQALADPTATATATPVGFIINQFGIAQQPVTVPACNGGIAYQQTIKGNYANQTWAIEPEGTNIRCTPGAVGATVPLIAPDTNVGFLYPSYVITPVAASSKGQNGVQFSQFCCGVGSSVSVSTYQAP